MAIGLSETSSGRLTDMEKTIQEYYLEITPYTQRFFIGKDYIIRGIADSGDGTMEMYVEVELGSSRERQKLPATYFYVFKTGEAIRPGLRYVGTVPMQGGEAWHVYLQPNEKVSA